MAITDELRKRGLYDVAEDIARGLHITVPEMLGGRKHPVVCEARRMFYRYLYALGWSYGMIGKLLGKDHSTVMYALRQS